MNDCQQHFLSMQQDLIRQIHQKMTIPEANQAFNCAYEAVNSLYDCLNRTLQTARWLDNPDIINSYHQQYSEEICKEILKITQEQAIDAFKKLPEYMGFLQEKKQSLTKITKVLQEKIAAAQVDPQQIEQICPNLSKVKHLEEQANLLLHQTTILLASKTQVDNTVTSTPMLFSRLDMTEQTAVNVNETTDPENNTSDTPQDAKPSCFL